MDSLNTILNSGTYGENVSRHNDNNSKIKQAITTLENVAIANKGYFDTLASLQAAFPSPRAGNIAYVANVASTTGYYIYNVVDGVWTASAVEAPPVSVPISNYAEHGYTGTPKTLKTVEDEKASEIAQLEGDKLNISTQYPPLTNDPRFPGIVDCYYGSLSSLGAEIRIIQTNKDTGRTLVRIAGDNISTDYTDEKDGIKIVKVGSFSTGWVWLLINWDLIQNVYDPSSTASFLCGEPKTAEMRSFFSMLSNMDYVIAGNVAYNDYEQPITFDIVWADGTSGNVVNSNYDPDVLEYKRTKAYYKGIEIDYGIKVFDSNGYIQSKSLTTIF